MQAKILLYITAKEELFEGARTFQDSLEASKSKIIQRATGPYILIIAKTCRCCCQVIGGRCILYHWLHFAEQERFGIQWIRSSDLQITWDTVDPLV